MIENLVVSEANRNEESVSMCGKILLKPAGLLSGPEPNK
jgi:hypothetical protein